MQRYPNYERYGNALSITVTHHLRRVIALSLSPLIYEGETITSNARCVGSSVKIIGWVLKDNAGRRVRPA